MFWLFVGLHSFLPPVALLFFVELHLAGGFFPNPKGPQQKFGTFIGNL